MLKKSWISSLLLSSLLFFDGMHADETPPAKQDATELCGNGPHPMRIQVRNIEAKGIGYNDGYTTVEGFFTPIYPNKWLPLKEEWLPFLDLRWHTFNNGKSALNAGLGIRYLTSHIVWGANAYYDYRKTSHTHYNQVGVGFEGLGRIWDFRINGYLPVGSTSSHTSKTFFEDHYLYTMMKKEFALKGFNAEAGIHISEFRNKWVKHAFSNTPFYVAAGTYYLSGKGKSSWGGQARFTLDIFDFLRLEGNGSYDDIYHGIGQGQLGFIIPFGKKKKVYAKQGKSCTRAMVFSERAIQRVDRFEIIPIKKKHKKQSPVINPATGQPYFFWFVDNTSNSAGTFESPFPTLLLAQTASAPNDIIYVFPGDGTSAGMSTGIVLQNYQQLLGSGIPQTLATTSGNVTIPAMSAAFPMITNTTVPITPVGDITMVGSGVTLANGNTVSGIFINQSQSHGIVGWGIRDATLINNVIMNTNIYDVGDGAGVNLISSPTSSPLGFLAGNFLIQGNTITGVDPVGANMKGILIDVGVSGNLSSTDVCSISILNNSVVQGESNGLEITPQGASTVTLNVSNNTIRRFSTIASNRGFVLTTKDQSSLTYNLENNQISSDGSTDPFRGPAFLNTHQSATPGNGTITDNTFFDSALGVRLTVSEPNVNTVALNNNTFFGNTTSEFDFDGQVDQGALLNLSFTGNSAPQWGYVLELNPSEIPAPAPNIFYYQISDFSNNVGILKTSIED